MAKLGINTGSSPNDGTGDTLRLGGTKVNTNFDELYAALGDGTNLSVGTGTTSILSLVYPNVGIGSAITAHKLDVNGNIGATNIEVSNINLSGILTTATANISTLSGVGTLDATTTATIESAIANLPNDFTYINVTGLATVANMSLTGVGTINAARISGVTTTTNLVEVRSDDGTPGRIDYYCEVSNAHYTRIQLQHTQNILEMQQQFYQQSLVTSLLATLVQQSVKMLILQELSQHLNLLEMVQVFTG